MLKLLDRVLLTVISWLYAKHTRIHLHLLAKESSIAPKYDPPIPEQIAFALKQFDLSVQELSAHGALHKARNIDKVRSA